MTGAAPRLATTSDSFSGWPPMTRPSSPSASNVTPYAWNAACTQSASFTFRRESISYRASSPRPIEPRFPRSRRSAWSPATIGAAVAASPTVSKARWAFAASAATSARPLVSAAGGLAPAYCASATRRVSMPSKSDVSFLPFWPGMVVSTST